MASKEPDEEVAMQLPEESVTAQERENSVEKLVLEADVWKSEWQKPEGGGGRPGKPPPEFFMTLQEAQDNGKIPKQVLDDINDYVWKSVVLITVPTGPNGEVECGTGFVFRIKQKQVMTNYHVVENHKSSIAPIHVTFFYDNDNDDGAHVKRRKVTGDPVYYSKGGEVDEQHLDFAVLNVEDIPDEAIGIPVENPHATATSPDTRSPVFYTCISLLLIYPFSQGIIVGHPGGGPKRISTVEFDRYGIPEYRYSQEGTWPGSSGSPVLINQPGISPIWSIILHYGASIRQIIINGVVEHEERECSLGVDMTYVVRDIIQQAKLRPQK